MPQGPIAAAIARTFQKALSFGQFDQQGALWESNRHGKYYAGVYGTPVIKSPAAAAAAGSSFRGANWTSVSLSVLLATTYTGLCLSNPIASTVNLAVKKVGGVVTSAPGGQLGLGLIAGWSAAGVTVHTTPLNTNIVNSYVGAAATGSPPIAGPASQANLDAACTLVGTPSFMDWLAANGASASATSFYADLDESIIIPPGGYIAIGSTAAQGGFFGSFFWEELPP
jgi:hypothetical protein